MAYDVRCNAPKADDGVFSILLDGIDQAGELSATIRAAISEGNDWTIRGNAHRLTASGNDVIFSSTNGSNDRVAINVEGSSIRARVYNAVHTMAKSGTIANDQNAEIVLTHDATAHTIKLWLDGVELVGTSTTTPNGTVGAFLGAASTGVVAGSQKTFKGNLWGWEFWESTITALSEIDGLTNYRKFPFSESAGSTSKDAHGSGDLITWNNSPEFAAIPD